MSKMSSLNSSWYSMKSSMSFLKERQKCLLPSKTFHPDVEEMKRVFNKFDTNKDGKISREEYKLALKALGGGKIEDEVSKAFEYIDSNRDGFIDLKEFMEVQDKDSTGVKEDDIDIARVFCVYDLDGDGKISAEDLKEVLRKLGEKCNLESCRKMVQAVDRDGDGMINLEEFTNMMTQSM